MASHPLDNPVWHALTGPHASLSRRSGGAMAYRPEIALFAAVENPVAADMDGLAALIPNGGTLGFPYAGDIPLQGNVALARKVDVLQMVAEHFVPMPISAEMVSIGAANKPAMVELVEMTKPGPFAPEAYRMGPFSGIFDAGRLVAMAGERMSLDGFSEVSAVCTHPDYRGRGYAKQLVSLRASDIVARGKTPFLHVFPNNAAAIATYERLGFVPRRTMTFTIVKRR
ncbi:MAG TPA: GNAT family N-acetyltransferase [Reyranella sp.]